MSVFILFYLWIVPIVIGIFCSLFAYRTTGKKRLIPGFFDDRIKHRFLNHGALDRRGELSCVHRGHVFIRYVIGRLRLPVFLRSFTQTKINRHAACLFLFINPKL